MTGALKLRLTKSSVGKLETRDSRYKVFDDELPGFFIVVSPNGRKSFYLRYRVGGGRGGTLREPKIGDAASMTPEQARRIARDWHAEIRLGGDPGGDRTATRNAPDVSHLLDRYLQDHARLHKKPSSVRNDTALIENCIRPTLGAQKVREISRADVMRLHSSLQATPYQANRVLALLSKAFGLAEYWGLRRDGTNPTLHVKKFKEEKRERYLSDEEVRRLADVLDLAERQGWLPVDGDNGATKRRPISLFMVAAVRLLMFTGARHGEILTLKWDWVDLANRQLSLPDSKTGRKTIILNELAVEVLDRLPRVADNPYVITGAIPGSHLKNLKDPWAVIRDNAGLKDFRLHDLRHSFASFAVAEGLSLPVIGALLGHSQPSTTARYAHLARDPLAAASELTADKIRQALGSHPRPQGE